jgi:Spy/CpxP family protein refolding chaperone
MKTKMMSRAALLLCSAALLALPALPAVAQQDAGGAPPTMGDHGPGGPGGGPMRMLRELNLTPDQQKQVHEIMEGQRAKIEALRDNSSLSQEDRRHEMMKIHEEGMQKVRAILTEEQKKKLDEMEKHMREHMRDRREDGQGMSGGDSSAPPPPPPPQQ